jgi:hypothetical protein
MERTWGEEVGQFTKASNPFLTLNTRKGTRLMVAYD